MPTTLMFRWPARNSLHGPQHERCGFSGDTELRAAGIGAGVDFRTFFRGWHASCGVLALRNPSFVPGYQRAEQPGHTLTCLYTYVFASQAALTTTPRGTSATSVLRSAVRWRRRTSHCAMSSTARSAQGLARRAGMYTYLCSRVHVCPFLYVCAYQGTSFPAPSWSTSADLTNGTLLRPAAALDGGHLSLALANGTQEAFTIAAPPSQGMVLASLAMDEQRDLLPAHVWRASARLGDSHWLCSQCGWASPNDGGNGGNEGVEAASCCLKCATPKAQSERLRGTPAEKLALTTISEASAYGRKLLFLRGRGQVERLACGAVPGTPGYTEAVRRGNIEAFAPVSRVLDPIPRAWVVLLDGYLAVVHAAKYRVWSRQDCLAVIRLEETEGLLGEFLGTFARTVSVCVEGIYRLVQVCSTVYPQPTPLTAPATLAGDRGGGCLTCGHWFAWRRHRHFPRADGGHVWRPP